MNPFKQLFTKGENLLKKKSDSFLGVDVGSSSIKVVQLKKKKGVVILETYGELSLGPYANIEAGRSTNLSASEISEALKSLLIESNVTTKQCGVSIPLKSSLIFTMSVPYASESQLSQMIPIEARKYIPVPVSEVDLDWKILPSEIHSSTFMGEEQNKEEGSKKDNRGQNNNINILVAAIHKDVVQKQKEIINGTDLNLGFLEIEIFSTIRAVAGQDVSTFAVLDLGSGNSKIYIVDGGMVRESHAIGRGSQDITLNISRSTGIDVKKAEEKKIKIGLTGQNDDAGVAEIVSSGLDYIFTEANKVVSNYQKKSNKNVDKIVITGGGAIINGMEAFVGPKFNMEVEVANPFSKIETPAFLDDLLKQVGPGFSVALGIALRGLRQLE